MRVLARVVSAGLFLTLAGCSFSMPPGAAPSEELIRVVAKAPEQYSLQMNTGAMKDYDVPQNGRIKVAVPVTGGPARFTCSTW
jgi:hypothetical protein